MDRRVAYYHGAKFPPNYSGLLVTFLMICRRVAKQKMNFKDVLDEVNDKAMWPFHWAEVKAELESDNVPRLKTNYEYAKNKLNIAKKMGLISSIPHTSMLYLTEQIRGHCKNQGDVGENLIKIREEM